MKLLWVKSDFLHPTTRGGQIRTLEMLKRLHARHEVHYMGFHAPGETEGIERSAEYCSKAWPVERRIPNRRSPSFAWHLLTGLVSDLPVSIDLYRSSAMQNLYRKIARDEKYDRVICDFLTPAPNIDDIERCVVFEHNVEYMIWRRHAQNAPTPAHKFYFQLQARKMEAYEGKVCRAAHKVIAVSETDAQMLGENFNVRGIESVPTGVDVDKFQRTGEAAPVADMVFVGAMDWMPNIDGIDWFVREVLPSIRAVLPEVTLSITGRDPSPAIKALEQQPGIKVTGTVPDVRPYLWGSKISIVPLRVGGGTRLKIYEAMAAGLPVVSTSVGAEGLGVDNGKHILLADDAPSFAAACIRLLKDEGSRREMSKAALAHIAAHYSWEAVTRSFEEMIAA